MLPFHNDALDVVGLMCLQPARRGGRLFARCNRSYAESGQRFPEVPRLTDAQREAMDAVDALYADPDLHLDMTLEPGDMQFVCNTSTLHSRTAYEDWPERERRRDLLRLWLDTGRIAELPPSYVDRHEDRAIWQRTPRPPVFDLSMRRAELAH